MSHQSLAIRAKGCLGIPEKAIGRIKKAYYNPTNPTKDDSLVVEFEGSINVIDDIKTDLRTDHLLEPSEEILHKNLRKSLQDHQEILHQMDSEDKLSISNASGTSGTGCDIFRTVDERATRTSDSYRIPSRNVYR